SGQEPGENGSGDGFGAVVRATAGKLRVIRKMKSGVNCFEMWWPGTELNRRRQPFQGCALPPELPGHVSRPASPPQATRIVRCTLIVAGVLTEKQLHRRTYLERVDYSKALRTLKLRGRLKIRFADPER